MLVSFFSLFLTYNLITFKKKNINFFQEDFYLLIYLFFIVIIFFIFFNLNNNYSIIFLALCSSISNIGISISGSYNNVVGFPIENIFPHLINIGCISFEA